MNRSLQYLLFFLIMLVSSAKYGPILLKPAEPDSISGMMLPDGSAFYGETELGTLRVHELITTRYTLRFCVYDFIRKVSLLIQEEASLLASKFLLKGQVRIQLSKSERFDLRERDYLLWSKTDSTLTSRYYLGNRTEQQFFDACYSKEMLLPLLQAFPSLEEFLGSATDLAIRHKINRRAYSSPEMTKIVYDLLRCPFNEKLRKLYFENKVNDLLFEILVQVFEEYPRGEKLDRTDREAIYRARDLIESDISRHFTLKELARQVNLNEFKLKSGFKMLFGMGTFECLMRARMEEARILLLETDKPLKEIAAITGFEYLTNFIAAFKKYFGYTPGELREK
jgi:AraC-like DNA-binding protein